MESAASLVKDVFSVDDKEPIGDDPFSPEGWLIGIIPTNVVRNRTDSHDVPEDTIEDLVVVSWVTPGLETVRSLYDKSLQHLISGHQLLATYS